MLIIPIYAKVSISGKIGWNYAIVFYNNENFVCNSAGRVTLKPTSQLSKNAKT
ncbi:hypothetical protein BHECKSOX2_972 [Bathymodiolus heckerae thiotrophic gill symbiont]|nr:hypothetical protein BHECKSOX2_972 [Bathymodiolus heckerae thiotrophic gill symbiont]SMN15971.1 hypothetical protein CRYPD_814 [uncultured Candidatus Thioglobus sp.]